MRPVKRPWHQCRSRAERLNLAAGIVDGIARGTISDEEARKRLVEPRQCRDAARAELAPLTPPAKVVVLHPAALTRYLAAIDDLATALSRRLVEGDEEVATSLRELISAAVIHPAGKDDPKIEVTGRLAQLTSAPDLFPNGPFGQRW
jgi:hypothetical protein